jgi:hypothetical protein
MPHSRKASNSALTKSALRDGRRAGRGGASSPAEPLYRRSGGVHQPGARVARERHRVGDRRGERFLRFEDFETSNGPDLLVYLSSKTPSGTDDWHGYDQDFVDLGPLKGNVGNQNYRIPADVDVDRYSTAVVWCRRFEVGFAAATLA